ncbi:MAG: hypothetical protein ABI321_17160 [Polyangia bacterium]
MLVLLSGCGAGVAQRLVRVHSTTVLARHEGAYACAPELLAQAETREAFAHLELSAGELMRAERETGLAEDRARLVLAAVDRCFAAAPVEAPKPVVVAPRRPDADDEIELEARGPEHEAAPAR